MSDATIDNLFGAFLALIVLLLLIAVLLFATRKESSPTIESNIETIRASQRECLEREPAHSFSLAQTQGGYMVECRPIK
jgi:hypothetical protein